jgi:hypothetical protein
MSCLDNNNANTGAVSDMGDLDDMVDGIITGTDLLKLVDLLPNSSQHYGHSIAMNALIKIIISSILP